MTYIYYIAIAIILALGLLTETKFPTKAGKITYLVICGILLAFIAGVRYETGHDYYSYLGVYTNICNADMSQFFSYGKEPGFFLWCKLLSLFSTHFQWFYIATAVLTTALIMIYIYRESTSPTVSVFIYVTFTFYYWSLNLVRQSLAAAISIFSIQFIKKKKLVPFLLVVLLAASFHKSALIMLPVYFIAQIKFGWKPVTIFGAAAVVAYIFAPNIVAFVGKYLYNGAYSIGSYYAQGASILYGILPVFVFAAAWCFKKKYVGTDATNSVDLNLLFYASVISLFITRVFIVERFAFYMFLPAIVIIPNMLATLKISPETAEKIDCIKNEIKSSKGTQLKAKQNELAKLNSLAKDAKIFYGFAIGCVIFVGLMYHMFALYTQFHGIEDYHWIFDKPAHTEFSYKRDRDGTHDLLLELDGYPTTDNSLT